MLLCNRNGDAVVADHNRDELNEATKGMQRIQKQLPVVNVSHSIIKVRIPRSNIQSIKQLYFVFKV